MTNGKTRKGLSQVVWVAISITVMVILLAVLWPAINKSLVGSSVVAVSANTAGSNMLIVNVKDIGVSPISIIGSPLLLQQSGINATDCSPVSASINGEPTHLIGNTQIQPGDTVSIMYGGAGCYQVSSIIVDTTQGEFTSYVAS
ncbi:MAG: hypothetical protein RXO22_05765 [Thermocladium sp.]